MPINGGHVCNTFHGAYNTWGVNIRKIKGKSYSLGVPKSIADPDDARKFVYEELTAPI